MLKYNEITHEFEDVPVRFYIGGQERSDDYYLVAIPYRYVDLFEGHNFPSLEMFKRALMHASVANEAWNYNRDWVAEDAERSMKRCFEKS